MNELISELEKELDIKFEEKNNGYYFGGYLDLRGTGITTLPENLSVGGSLDLRGTGIATNENWIISKELGSRNSITSYQVSKDIIRCGCFVGSLEEFKNRVDSVYPSGVHRHDYFVFIELIESLIEK